MQYENLSKNILQEPPVEQLQTQNSKLQTEAMEVHHPKAEKKNFKEYFLEFLMIFLAVTMGLLAENLREKIKVKKEIHENIESVLAGPESDVAHFNSVMDVNTYSYTLADSLVNLLHNDLSNTSLIYAYARGVTANVDYFYTNSKTLKIRCYKMYRACYDISCTNPENIFGSC